MTGKEAIGAVKPSITHVAREAGVSKSTVSRALAGDRRVKAETRLRIEEVARRLGYSRHRIASALARGRTFMVAVATPAPPRSFSDPFFLEFLGALGDRLTSAGYNLVLTLPDRPAASGSRDLPASAPGSLEDLVVGSMVDGAVLTEIAADDPRLAMLVQHQVPFVTLGTPEPAAGGSAGRLFSVDGDNAGGARLAVQHLIELGHREIACVTGPLHLVAARRRLSGFTGAMERAGACVPPHRVVEADFTREGGFAAARRLIEAERAAFAGVRLSAIFACNDLMAIGVIEALRDAGLRVPEDVSVVGFDGINLGRLVDPPLTTAAQPIRQLGTLVAELLLEQIGRRHRPDRDLPAAGPEPGARSVVVPCVLHPGRSTAPANGSAEAAGSSRRGV